MKQYVVSSIAMLALSASAGAAGDAAWSEIPRLQWKGLLDAEAPALSRKVAAAVALPAQEARPLAATTADAQPPGLYEIRLTVRPSHAAGAIAFNAGLRVRLDGKPAAEFPGCFFARPHEPETRVVAAVHEGTGPLAVVLEAFADPAIAEAVWVASDLKTGGPKPGVSLDPREDDDADLEIALDTVLAPAKSVYYVVDRIEFRPLSRGGRVLGVETDRIRYLPGATLKGRAFVADAGGRGGNGTLNLHLEHRVGERTKVKSHPVILGAKPAPVDFELTLPMVELGYALVAEYVSADGIDRSEASEYFTIASNFQRVAIFGGGLATRDAVLDDAAIRRGLAQARSGYGNAVEYFAWAEDDLVEMSPSKDFWSSGQTNYRMHKQTLQRQIRLAHEQGVAVSTYGKYLMSGYPGWETAYDYPLEHRGQYYYPIGTSLGISANTLDRRRHGDTRSYIRHPDVKGNAFDTWWNHFLPINSDATPRMVRLAAEECARSIAMFGWDAIRWDDHPRGGGQCGRAGGYDPAAARRTQSLVRYFKDIVARHYPDFRHGYNYLGIQREKGHDWAMEDFELDELCRGGGLLMNESIGNASGGYTFAQIARNLQVDGDLCRERGGYYLGISYAKSPRDVLIESALWGAAGCRPYSDGITRETRRYCTRYAHYTFDENLRRLARPEKVLAPVGETRLWWQPFVYETPLADGRRQLVVNLLNLPLEDKRPGRDSDAPPAWNMPAGTDPVEFELTLPEGLKAVGVTRIEPWTLAVAPVALAGNRFTVAPVAIWSVLVIDLAVTDGAPSLGQLHGPPATFGVPRPGLLEAKRKPAVVLDPTEDLAAADRRFAALQADEADDFRGRDAKLDALAGDDLQRELLARRTAPEVLTNEWWKGASLPADLALKGKAFNFGNLAPRRNGRVDIYHARGCMDYRLSLPCAFARLDQFRVHDAPLGGGGLNYYLAYRADWPRFPEFDLLLFTSIPHSAIGAENSYALVEYVKAGGAAFFTGGEYGFGKGGYMHTVLERELLPFQCAGVRDTAYVDSPRSFEPGPDFAELGVKLDFAARPAYWVRNRAVLKPGAKVFLKSGDLPILVGWQFGKGRVACLLVDHRGKSEPGVTAFWDWQDWPTLAAAVMRWLAPDARRSDPVAPAGDVRGLVREFEDAGGEELLDGLDAADNAGAGDMPGGALAVPGKQLAGTKLDARVKLITRALDAGDSPELAAVLASQLATVGSLPLEVRLRIVSKLQQERPAGAAQLGRIALKTAHSVLHGSGCLLLAVAGDPGFSALLASSPPALAIDTELAARERARDLALGVALYPKPDLVDEGRKRVAAWDRQEAESRGAFARKAGDDMELVETSGPYLDAEAVFARIAWLAYLSRHDPAAYARSFAREWLWIGQYQDYVERTVQGLSKDAQVSAAARALQQESWRNLSARLGALRELARRDAERLLAERPADVAAAMAGLRFAPQIRDAVNLLGDRPAAETAAILSALEKAVSPDLARFAAERRAAQR